MDCEKSFFATGSAVGDDAFAAGLEARAALFVFDRVAVWRPIKIPTNNATAIAMIGSDVVVLTR